jgi:NADH-quinone oxidoreductase subunit N
VNPSEIATAQGGAFVLIVPEIILGLTACVLFLGSTVRSGRHLWGGVAVLGLFAAALALWLCAERAPTIEVRQLPLAQKRAEIEGMSAGPKREAAFKALEQESKPVQASLFAASVVQSRLGLLTRWMALVGGLVLVLFSWYDISDRWAADYHACLLLIVAGTGLTAMANDLVTLFVALELISIPTYLLLYLQRTDRPAQEAAAKYFLLSIFSSALLLFGFSYLYGLTGTTNIPAVLDALRGKALPLLAVVAVVMIVAGLGFRITAVPFHFYAPDVYQGTATTAAAMLAFMPKVAGFVALLRVLGFIWDEAVVTPGLVLGLRVPTVLFWILATITMCVGNVLALLQDNLKRLLAYSSVAHAGYMLIALAAAPGLSLNTIVSEQNGIIQPLAGGAEAVLFYLAVYGGMTLGVFGVIVYLSTPERPVETVDDLAGLGSSHPGVALVMALFLFSLIGIPLTAGFAGKFLIFFGALGVPAVPNVNRALPDVQKLQDYALMLRYLAAIGAINAAMAGWYYLRIVAAMYLRSPLKPLPRPYSWPGLAALGICAAVTLGLGVYPWPMVEAARAAANSSPVVAEPGKGP